MTLLKDATKEQLEAKLKGLNTPKPAFGVPFNSNNLSLLAYANNFTLWHYTTTGKSIEWENYFSERADMLRVNDMIVGQTDTAETPSTALYIVTKNTGTAVTVNKMA